MKYKHGNLVSYLLINPELVVKNVERLFVFTFANEKKRNVTAFPFHLTEID